MGVTFLLDTHAFLWAVGHGHDPRPETKAALEAEDSSVKVSAVSAFEMATKVRIGKLPHGARVAQRWSVHVQDFGAEQLELSTKASLRAGALDWTHRDPFDRLLVAQAIEGDLVLVTADRIILDSGIVRTLSW